VIFPHLDVGVVEEALARPHPGGRTFLVTESLFSMDGDIAPLDLYGDLADRYGAELIVDEAHATGVFGDVRGSGLVERFGLEGRVTAVVSTFGKALGLAGAWVAGSGVVIDYLVSRCRSFLFSTAMPPLWLFSMAASLDLLAAEPWRRRQVLALADLLRRRLRAGGLEGCRGEGPIVPVILGEVARTVEMAEVLQGRGFDVRAIRPPTVPPGTSRLRISVHADHREEDLEVLAEEILAQLQGACRVGTSGAVP
jgi:8-amino-7-oxononanoate synthase